MSNKILYLMIALPVLILGIGQSWASSSGSNTLDFNVPMLTEKTLQVQPHTPHSAPITLAARDQKTEKCSWFGRCDDN